MSEVVPRFSESVAAEGRVAEGSPRDLAEDATRASVAKPAASRTSNAGAAGSGLLPSVMLPKCGGAIRGIGEKFSTNAATGTISLSVPIATSPGRAGGDLALHVTYDSGAGNGPFGLGWRLSTPSISRKTDKGLPRYADAIESDVFLLSGAEDLVATSTEPGNLGGVSYDVVRFRPRVEGSFARIERWTTPAGDIHWRVVTKDNVLQVYGHSEDARVRDPEHPERVFSWLIEETRDDRGNVVAYVYKKEDGAGVEPDRISEQSRFEGEAGRPLFVATAQRYLKRIRYGNRTPVIDRGADVSSDAEWLFEVVFDYGEHTTDAPSEVGAWTVRSDPFSTYRPGFDLRTYRLCRRVLMFHQFGDAPFLVRSTDFTYAEQGVRSEDGSYDSGPVLTYLRSVTQRGYNGADRAALPPLEFGYVAPILSEDLRALDDKSLAGIARGVGSSGAEWVDLDGEGIPGVLITSARAWFYKRNLGGGNLSMPAPVRPLPGPAELHGGTAQLTDLGADGNLDLVRYAPPLAGYFERTNDEGWTPFVPFRSLPNIDFDDPNLRFVDLDGDGFPDLFISGDDSIVWWRSRGKEGFEPAKYVAKSRDERQGPAILHADRTEAIALADMSGDGLLDIVRARNGEVCYWPNLGHGRFGRKVVCERSPRFDDQDQFDPTRVRFADLDGSGTSDVLYLGQNGVHVYFNCAGNSLSAPRKLGETPPVDSLSTIRVVDLFGRGTPSLVLSSPLSNAAPVTYLEIFGWRRPDGTIERGKKPHLLESTVNNMGAASRVTYASSTKFYLMDRAEGRPWLTRLPFPVQVVEKLETIDLLGRASLVSEFRYRHGHYDGVEREFCGFARVDQCDKGCFGQDQALAAGATADSARTLIPPPVRTRTWFHTGAWLEREQLEAALGKEYWSADPQGPSLPDAPPLPGTTTREQREAARALRGSVLRREIYADDGRGEMSERPYSVSESRYGVRLLVPAPAASHAVVLVHPVETFESRYERVADDPRISHQLVTSVDDFGNLLESASIGYGRRDPDPTIPSRFAGSQTTTLVTYTVRAFTNPVDDAGSSAYRTPLLSEARTYELTGATPSSDPATDARRPYFSVDDVTNAFRAAQPLDYGEIPSVGVQRRRVEHVRTIYRADDLSAPLAAGKVESRALKFEDYRLAFTNDLLGVYARTRGDVTSALIGDVPAVMTAGGYRSRADLVTRSGFPSTDADDRDDDWWSPSGRVFFSETETGDLEQAEAKRDFYLVKRAEDPFGSRSFVRYDKSYRIVVVEVEDAAGNLVTAGERRATDPTFAAKVDFRVLQPSTVMDANENREAVAFDALGVVIAVARQGKVDEPGRPKGDLLANFKAGAADVAAFFDDPIGQAQNVLGDSTRRFVYDAFAFANTVATASPRAVVVATVERETHVSDLAPGQATEIELALAYFDGLGRAIQTKTRAEAGPLAPHGDDVDPRWVGSGWVVFDLKGRPVRKYEPFFSATHAFEIDSVFGVSSTLFYDPLDRVVATLHPDHTYEKVVFGAWTEAHWDANDNSATAPAVDTDVGGLISLLPATEYTPSWPDHETPGDRTPEEAAAAAAAAVHAATPTTRFLDVLARPFLVVAHNRRADAGAFVDELLPMYTELDIEGLERAVVDASRASPATSLATIHGEGRVVMRYAYDVAGRRIFEVCMDAGERWTLPDVGGRPIGAWDRIGRSFRLEYDALRRPIASYVRGHDAADRTKEIRYEATTYGDAGAKAQNLCGRIYEQRDAAGVLRHESYDFKGNLLRKVRQLAEEFREALDWASTPLLEPGPGHASAFVYDALDRVVLVRSRDGAPTESTRRVSFGTRGLVARVEVGAAGTALVPYVDRLTYDEKGQRLTRTLHNGVKTTWTYDPRTFRLQALAGTRASGETLQDLSYTYDAVGNISSLYDAAQQTIYFDGDVVTASASYTYDATYRLIVATGREHTGQVGTPAPDAWDTGRTGLPDPRDSAKMRNYRESYEYDEVGNLSSITHTVGTDTTQTFTRGYGYERPSRIEAGRNGNFLTKTTVGETKSQYDSDEHGNTTSMPHLAGMAWDHLDRLASTAKQVGGPTLEATYNVYDARGMRVRKITCSPVTGLKSKERVYLDELEIFRELVAGAVTLERESLHVSEGGRSVALTDTRTDVAAPLAPLVRFQLDNHLGSAIVEVDDSVRANLISYEEYHPFGSTSYQAQANQTYTNKRYRYTGKERDEESGFGYHGARYYAQWLGRWVSPDPARLIDGPNVYAFVQNRPIVRVDTTGRGQESFDSGVRGEERVMALDQSIANRTGADHVRMPSGTTPLRGTDGSLYKPDFVGANLESKNISKPEGYLLKSGEVNVKKVDRFVNKTISRSQQRGAALGKPERVLFQVEKDASGKVTAAFRDSAKRALQGSPQEPPVFSAQERSMVRAATANAAADIEKKTMLIASKQVATAKVSLTGNAHAPSSGTIAEPHLNSPTGVKPGGAKPILAALAIGAVAAIAAGITAKGSVGERLREGGAAFVETVAPPVGAIMGPGSLGDRLENAAAALVGMFVPVIFVAPDEGGA